MCYWLAVGCGTKLCNSPPGDWLYISSKSLCMSLHEWPFKSPKTMFSGCLPSHPPAINHWFIYLSGTLKIVTWHELRLEMSHSPQSFVTFWRSEIAVGFCRSSGYGQKLREDSSRDHSEQSCSGDLSVEAGWNDPWLILFFGLQIHIDLWESEIRYTTTALEH